MLSMLKLIIQKYKLTPPDPALFCNLKTQVWGTQCRQLGFQGFGEVQSLEEEKITECHVNLGICGPSCEKKIIHITFLTDFMGV